MCTKRAHSTGLMLCLFCTLVFARFSFVSTSFVRLCVSLCVFVFVVRYICKKCIKTIANNVCFAPRPVLGISPRFGSVELQASGVRLSVQGCFGGGLQRPRIRRRQRVGLKKMPNRARWWSMCYS